MTMIAVGFCLATFGTRYAQLREAAQRLDALGFASLHVWDHYVSWTNPRESVLEAWTTLAGLAEATRQIRIGPMVANNLNRHPGRLAKVAATLHELSGGRCDLGLGSGTGGIERDAFGLPVDDARARGARLAEALQIIPALWRGEPVTFHGQYYQLVEAIASPAQDPPPRLIVAASQTGTARLAGHHADGVNFAWVDHPRYAELLAAVEAGLAERGRSRDGFDVSIHIRWTRLQPDPVMALREWETLGFTRAIVYLEPPFPLDAVEALLSQTRRVL